MFLQPHTLRTSGVAPANRTRGRSLCIRILRKAAPGSGAFLGGASRALALESRIIVDRTHGCESADGQSRCVKSWLTALVATRKPTDRAN